MTALASLTGKVKAGEHLSRADVTQAMRTLLDGVVSDEGKAEFLTVLAEKGETAEEIAAFATELRARAVDPQIDPAKFGGVVLDVVGTGADLSNTFNISTCTVFIAAAAGVAVAKHGNRAITSKCGAADVLTTLGAKIELPPEAARRCLEAVGVTFLFAQFYHPVFKVIAPVRRALAERKQRTVFNILGPLANPARPTHQLIGVFDRRLVGKFAEVLRLLGLKHAMVVHGDGLDELSTMGMNTMAELWAGRIEQTERDFRVPHTSWRGVTVKPEELVGGDAVTNAGIVRDVLGGKDRGARRDIVLLNAAAALVVAEKATDFAGAWALAAELIDSGAARERLERFVAATNQA
ncbi:MAG TPA: anthranilate phosphoribosyltransferase [Verrucomicrobiae bacterium]|nr:anthranilate phosphoribosyltransferase [Verrucomicrobiae bacterium]